jgi:thioredoxin-related protein
VPFLTRIIVIVMFLVPTGASAETYMLMDEEDGCYWCQKWDDEIAHIYPKTTEGKTAPLKRYDLHDETPEVEFKQRVHYTPTFILVRNGRELGRIEGYPGEDHFWALLTMLFENAKIPLDVKG